MSTAYAAEKQVAVAAVRLACVLTASVFNKLVKQETLTKDDKSPVTDPPRPGNVDCIVAGFPWRALHPIYVILFSDPFSFLSANRTPD